MAVLVAIMIGSKMDGKYSIGSVHLAREGVGAGITKGISIYQCLSASQPALRRRTPTTTDCLPATTSAAVADCSQQIHGEQAAAIYTASSSRRLKREGGLSVFSGGPTHTGIQVWPHSHRYPGVAPLTQVSMCSPTHTGVQVWPHSHRYPCVATFTQVSRCGPTHTGVQVWPHSHMCPGVAPLTQVSRCGPIHTGVQVWPHSHRYPGVAPFTQVSRCGPIHTGVMHLSPSGGPIHTGIQVWPHSHRYPGVAPTHTGVQV